MKPPDQWDDDRDRGGGGVAGDWRSTEPRFDDPMSWSIPIGQFAGVTVRVHALFLVLVIVALVKSVTSDPASGASTMFDLQHTLVALGALFLIVLPHEFGHVFACRQTGGEADEILLWPLGGLAYCSPPHRWTAELWTVLGGPLVNVGLWVVCAATLGLTVGWKPSVLFPDPFGPIALASIDGRFLEALFIFHWVNWVMLLFNVCLPCFPLDGGRIVCAILMRKLGYSDAVRIASRIGVIGAIVMGVVAIVYENWLLGGIAVFCAASCIISLRRVDAADALQAGVEDPGSAAERRASERRAQRRAEHEAKRREAIERESNRLDAILDKIRREGKGSLTWAEHRFLKRATHRRRGK